MNHRICLTNDPSSAGFPLDKSAVWVHHKSDVAPGERSVEVDTFVKDPRPYYANADCVVLLNLVSKIIRPGSRLKYGQYLTDPWNGPPRVSVDTHLFIQQPWRAWFHFGAVDAPFGEPAEKYHTSYRVETDWNFYLEGKIPNPCTIARIERYGAGVVVFRHGFRFLDTTIEVVAMDESVHADYADEKEEAFSECKTATSLLKRLSDYAQSVCPTRSIPKDLFSYARPSIIVTDLGIDKYLLGEINQQIALTNQIAETFRDRTDSL